MESPAPSACRRLEAREDAVKPLTPDQLVRRCDPASFPFETTAELPDVDAFFGQQRAVDAVRFGIGMRHEGFNLYVMGPPGIGKQTLVERCLAAEAAHRPAPSDWCYVMNFADARRPRALRLPAGRGEGLRRDMADFVDELKAAIPAIFASEEYRTRREAIDQTYAEREQTSFRALGEEAQKLGIAVLRTPGGFTLAPLKDGEVIDADAYEKLPEDEKAISDAHLADLQERLHRFLAGLPRWGREHREHIRTLNQEFARHAVDHVIDDVRSAFRDLPQVLEYLDQVRADIVDNAEFFLKAEVPAPQPGTGADPASILRRYQVNLIIDHGGAQGPPVVLLDHCALPDLVGRVEHVAQLGALVTDFSLIKAGALHRAHGGYLLLDVVKLLTQPFAWEALKRCLRSGKVHIDALADHWGLAPTVSLEPEPLPLDAKIVLFGDRLFYYLLHEYDPDFRELFKVQADFSERIPRTAEGIEFYARFAATVGRRDGLVPLDRSAVAGLVEYGARRSEDGQKLSTHLQDLADLLREIDYWARAAGKSIAGRDEVERAITARMARADRLRDEVHDAILRDILVIDSTGMRVAQVNGLSVLRLGDFEFAEPTRITATVRLGEGDVLDIQREVEMGGALHSKGVMILASFLGARFARTAPLSLAASLVFEQTYDSVEGDSASLAELCALLSALAEVPLRQSLAVTGSIDQHGRVQAIGAVNEKIEGFFDLCAKRGLTGAEGVLIPAANVDQLMLRQDVVDAAREGRFAVYAVATVDEAIELLTGLPAGAPDARGVMAEHGINARVQTRLHEFSLVRRDFGRRGKHRFMRHHD
ncbi:MAG: AAA family ATPase [Betaproteobacteria bacterium]|nr:AAA family ATPase [Betaproteobacteria bacterium]